MLFLTATPTAQPDYVALAMVVVLLLVVLIMVIRKYVSNKRKANAPVEVEPAAAVPAAPAAPQPEAEGTAGQLKLHNVDPKAAAMVMAIVADKLDKPLNQLRFLSIKEVK